MTEIARPQQIAYFDSFDTKIESAGTLVKMGAFRSPNTNAYVERFIQTIQQECLDYFVVLGDQHMDQLANEVDFYHEEPTL